MGILSEWIGEDIRPPNIPSLNKPELRNAPDRTVTIRIDTGVVHETDTGNAKSDENTWMRLILDTVGKVHWPADPQGRPIYPEGYEDLAKKLDRPLHPPGRDIRCIVSVGMLTEGWDCNTVTHVVGLRPFQSQLLCEQVVGQALRRRFYNLNEERPVRRGGGAGVRRAVRGGAVQGDRRHAEASSAAAAGSRGAAEGTVRYHGAAGVGLFDRRAQPHCG